MLQIIQSYKTGEMKLEDVPKPTIAAGTVLVETKASVVSAGTEKMIVELARKSLLGKAKARPDLVRKVVDTARKEGILNTFRKVQSKLENPIPLGYSCAGIVREVGDGAGYFQAGDHVACGGAGYATHAEQNIVPKNLCVQIPKRKGIDGTEEFLTFEEAAFATVGAIALQGVRQAGLTLGERVCVIGLGLLGQLTVQLCKAHGCRVIGCDIDGGRVELAKRIGADDACLTAALEEKAFAFTRGIGADAVIITASAKGSELVTLAGELSRMKGRVVAVGLVGLDVPRDIYYKKELDLRLCMSYGPGRYDVEYEERGHDYPLPYVRWTEQRNMQAFLELVASGHVQLLPLISHRYPFDRALEAYEMITGGRESSLGVILQYAAKNERQTVPNIRPSISGGSKEIRLGAIGAGNFAKGVLLPRLKKEEHVRFEAVITARGFNSKAVADQFGFASCADTVDSVIESKSINTILIATRHNLHGPLVKKALEAGKHVFVEKPLCTEPRQLAEVARAYKEIGQKGFCAVLAVGFNRRFSPYARKAKDILMQRTGPIIASYRINAGFIPRESWVQDPAEGGGRIVGEVCHFVDTLRYLVGSAVETVGAACVKSDDVRQVDRDSVAITLTYEDGSLATILYHALGSDRYPKEKIELAATGRIIEVDDFRHTQVYGKPAEKMKGKQDKGFDAELKAFVDAVVNGGAPPIPFDQIYETTLVTFAIESALNTGQTVRLPDFAREIEQ